MEYNFTEIEAKWQAYWHEKQVYKVTTDPTKPKFYVLDMFPYPSGAGLHVGHPLGYIASDIFSRYKRQKGFNVLHPMGYDAYGLPAEQYAIQTGQHPAITTERNIKRYREQLDKIGFCYDWSREVRTCEPNYYKWTQWAFIKMYEHWYDLSQQKALKIEDLCAHFSQHGNAQIHAASTTILSFNAAEWNASSEEKKSELLLNYRIAYQAEIMANWCPALGCVLANDEVKDGLSVRGSHLVEQKKMRQWCLRVSAYAQRLLDGLDHIEWSESLKEIQRNWIGRSAGAEIFFPIKKSALQLLIYTTRPDTIFGATFMVLAPEHEYIHQITTDSHKAAVQAYLDETLARTERERMTDIKKVSGVFTGAYVQNPFNGKDIPVWISDYVLSGFGTGAIMAVPAHDQRDYDFAKHFNIPIIQVIDGGDISEQAYDSKEAKTINSDFITGLHVSEAAKKIIDEVEKKNIGRRKVNFRLRDATFSRQRYWGEPFPVYYKNGMPQVLNEKDLPLTLPDIDKYLPTEKGEPPLGRATNWHTADNDPYELCTMPGFAGSSAYYLRYMDPQNDSQLVSKEANEYWRSVDLYVGGTEHATGHLVYSRFWNKFLFDLGIICEEEPFRKLINQGMIQGRSNFVYRLKNSNIFISKDMIGKALSSEQLKEFGDAINTNEVSELHVDVNIVDNDILNTTDFCKWIPEYKSARFILNNEGKYLCGHAVEKMSKSMYNVVNPDTIIEKYGADTLRLYEMFLGPIEQSKPWDTKGIDGVSRFLRKYWRTCINDTGKLNLSNEEPSREELKTLHKTIRKVAEDIERFSYNTSVSAFMICMNELIDLKCNKKAIFEPLTIVLSSFAPHISEEIWSRMGHTESIVNARFPDFNDEYLTENSFEYPVSFNGKLRFKKLLPLSLTEKEIEQSIIDDPNTPKQTEGKAIKKIIIVRGKIVNVVI